MAQAKRKTPERIDPLISRDRLLQEFGMITLEELATLWGVDVKTLQNRATTNDLPPHTRVGGKRLFYKTDVDAYMRKHMA
jgi:excisionase family DNA binding protein